MTRPFESRRSGKPLFGTLGAEAERLGGGKSKDELSLGDKNTRRPREMISPEGAESRSRKLILRDEQTRASLPGT
ncbi:MAG TPA: hypothetical protein PKA82_07510 [Pyrinomonadaceae bacterium]|nr:hypothetical protein [Pyrinomonadaceae bacterium]